MRSHPHAIHGFFLVLSSTAGIGWYILKETIVLRVCEQTGMPAIDARSIVRELRGGDVSLRSVLSTGFEPDAVISSSP